MQTIWNGRGAAKTIIVAIIFIILLAVIIIQRSQKRVQENKVKAEEEAPLIANFNPDDIYSIEIYELLGKTILAKKDGQWFVGAAQIQPNYSQKEKEEKPVTAWDKADEDAIRQVLETVKSGLTGKELVSTNRENKITFRAGILGSKFVFKNEKGETIACIEIGQKASDFSGTYVSLCDKDEIYKIPGLMDVIFKKDANGWRSKQVFDLDKVKISKIVATGPKFSGPISVAKGTDGKWVGVTPSAFPVDDASLDAILTKISTYKASGFPERMNPNETIATVELEITATLDDGSTHTLTFGSAERMPDKLVRGSDTGIIYSINPNDIDELTKQFEGLLTGTSSSETTEKATGEQTPSGQTQVAPPSTTRPPTPVPIKPPPPKKPPSGK